MNNIPLTALLVAVLSATQGLNILLRNRSNRQFRAFALFCGALVVTNLATALFVYEAPPMGLWGPLRLVGALACTVTATRFFSLLLMSRSAIIRERPGTTPAALVLSMVVLLWYRPGPDLDLGQFRTSLLTMMSGAAPPVEALRGTAPFEPSQLVSHVIILLVATYVFGTLAVLIAGVQRLRRVARSPGERARLALLFWLGSSTVLATAIQGALIFYYPDGFDLPVGGLAQLIFVYFLSQTLLQYRLLDLQEMVSKLIIFISLSVVVAASYAVLLAAFGDVDARFDLMITLLLASGIVLTLYEPLRAEVIRLSHRLFFRRRYQLQRELDALEEELPTLVSSDLLLDRMLAALQSVPQVTHAAIYLWDERSKGYRQQRRFGPDDWHPRDVIPGAGPFIDLMASRGEAYVVEDLERELDIEQGEENQGETHHQVLHILATLEDLAAEVVVPVVGPEVVMGFLALRGDQSERGFTHDEVVLLTDLARRASAVLRTSESLARLTERERLAALGAMSAGLAHEIRNPLGAIRGAAQFLTGVETDAESREFLDIIVEEVDRLNHVVSDFLDYSRPIRLESAPIDVGGVVRQTARLLEAGGLPAGVRLQLDLANPLPTLEADEEKLKQVFLNLARNALQALARGGTLTLSARLAEGPGIRAHRPVLLISFQDDGVGIPPQNLPKLFIPFFTTRREGNGLGLAICQRLIEAHGGTIEVESQVGHGSTFTVRLPVRGPAGLSEPPGPAEPAPGVIDA